VDGFVDKDRDKGKKNPISAEVPGHSTELDEFFRQLKPQTAGPKPNADAIAAALEAAQRFAAEADAEDAADGLAKSLSGAANTTACSACGYHNRKGNRFCGKCGAIIADFGTSDSAEQRHLPASNALTLPENLFLDHDPAERQATTMPSGQETHHYHHHYHHHYFPGGEAMAARASGDSIREPVREEKLRATPGLRGDLSRAEAAVRRIAQDWAVACNTKHLDDLIELYTADALVLRSNCPPIRAAAAVREFFFGALDAGLGEVELDPLRVEVVGDLAYEAGRCKALIPGATGKRREERGKYLWVCARQNNGEWKLAADCWSSDLTLSTLESDVPQSAGVKTAQPRKSL
jgi:ketosteroid isomerase-like protein